MLVCGVSVLCLCTCERAWERIQSCSVLRFFDIQPAPFSQHVPRSSLWLTESMHLCFSEAEKGGSNKLVTAGPVLRMKQWRVEELKEKNLAKYHRVRGSNQILPAWLEEK